MNLSTKPEAKSSSLDNLIGNLSKDQIQQFIALFSSQLQNNNVSGQGEASTSQNTNEIHGITFSKSTFCFISILTVSQNMLNNYTLVLELHIMFPMIKNSLYHWI